ncbi:uncharacterized protein LOC110060143 [Orbicella faveolata]|uniref:uncharacterized protein LOC110060142 n=1 Tax=Orbicella faveolata TaxID=48498 RepID=UPI0009E5AD4E|nr:uncharacterized protein LOC110060142 [Orbicella faveolata]XP_020622554.1 uncharacterized protein LOC110060143 [Orbicella faveolata]
MASEARSEGEKSKRNGSIMEWTGAHDLILAKEVRASEPWIFKLRNADRGKLWNAITDSLNDETSLRFQVKKKNVQEHFKLLLDKFKAKQKHQAKLGGVDIEDSEMDILMEEISEKWEEAEAYDLGCISKEKADSDRAIGEEIRRKACEKLGETSKRNAEEKAEPVAKKSRRSGSETLDFLREKVEARQAEAEREAKMHQELLTMIQNQNAAILQILNKMADK